jgi:hypothetical protein
MDAQITISGIEDEESYLDHLPGLLAVQVADLPMKRALIVSLLLVLSYFGLLFHFQGQAFRRYHGGPHHTERSLIKPASAKTHEQELHQALAGLVECWPSLAQVERRYLGEPLEETQSLLFSLAQQALRQGNRRHWQVVTRVLNAILLVERSRQLYDGPTVRQLALFQDRLQALYAQARTRRFPGQLPVGDEWTQAARVRILICRRILLWKGWEKRAGLLTWHRACQVLDQLDHWPPPKALPEIADLIEPLRRL